MRRQTDKAEAETTYLLTAQNGGRVFLTGGIDRDEKKQSYERLSPAAAAWKIRIIMPLQIVALAVVVVSLKRKTLLNKLLFVCAALLMIFLISKSYTN